ncbi:MAG: NUDIX domain-containing protein [Oligoflexia bacterium]|nr:NUDIX domain-containing protein [Oligoflexia bacterium]
MSIYRFESMGIGVYAAVEKDCDRNDPRRKIKPSGLWLPKVGESYKGAKSFFTKKGLQVYLESGLQEWHRYVLVQEPNILVGDSLETILYQDEYQLIGHGGENFKNYSWENFLKQKLSYPLEEKVAVFLFRKKNSQIELLVFEHDKKWSEAGIQVPAGGIEADESAEDAARREVWEESGLRLSQELTEVSSYYLFRSSHKKLNHRRVFYSYIEEERNSWTHRVASSGLDEGMSFHYYWIPWENAPSLLAGSLGYSLQEESLWKFLK